MTSSGHVTSSGACAMDSPYSSLYRLSIRTIPLSGLVSEIFSLKVADRMTEWRTDRHAKWLFIRVTKAERSRTNNPVNSDFGLLDPDGDPDRHQNLITWSRTCLRRRTNGADFYCVSIYRTRRCFLFFLFVTCPWSFWTKCHVNLFVNNNNNNNNTLPRNFVKICSRLFQLSDGQTDRQTDRSKNKNITSFFGGGNEKPALEISRRRMVPFCGPCDMGLRIAK